MEGAPEAEVIARFTPILGRAMRVLRDRRGYSQERVAQLAGVSRETVRRLEAGIDTTTTMVDRLLNAMDYDGKDLLKELHATRPKLNGQPQRTRGLEIVESKPLDRSAPRELPLPLAASAVKDRTT